MRKELIALLKERIMHGEIIQIDQEVAIWIIQELDKLEALEQSGDTPASGFEVN